MLYIYILQNFYFILYNIKILNILNIKIWKSKVFLEIYNYVDLFNLMIVWINLIKLIIIEFSKLINSDKIYLKWQVHYRMAVVRLNFNFNGWKYLKLK